jgi:hypothetical protein
VAGSRWVVTALAGALLSATLVLAVPRARPQPALPTTAQWQQLLAALDPQGVATQVPGGWRLQPQGRAACHFELDNLLRPALPATASRDLSCLAWRDAALQGLASRWPAWSEVRAGTDLPAANRLDRILLTIAALVAGALLPLGVALLLRLQGPERRLIARIFALSLLLRLLWPWRWTAVYFAYEWFDQARFLDSVPRYGPGALVPWAWLLGPVGESPQLVHAVQLVIGSLGVAAWTAAAAQATGRLGSAQWAGLALAATPVILRNDVSESMHVPALAALGLAAWAAVDVRRSASWLSATTLAASLSYAVLCRADLLPTAVLTVLAMAWIAPSAAAAPKRWHWLAAVPAAGVLGSVAWLASDRARTDQMAGNLPQVQRFAADLPQHLLHDAVLWRPDWWPLVAWLALVAAVLWLPSAERRTWRWLALLVVALLSLLPSWLDYNETSLPRLQAPAQVLATVALVALGEPALAPRPRLRWSLVILWTIGVLATLPATLRRTAAHDEDELLTKLLASNLPPGVVALRSYADEPAQGLHLHWPTWWLRSAGLRPVPVGQVRQSLDAGAQPVVPLYVFRSLRCHALPLGGPTKRQDYEQPDCERLAHHSDMEPIWEFDLPNHSDTATFAWYGRNAALRVGLYRWHPSRSLGMQPQPR